MHRVIMHVDLDAFFASCEEARNPALKGKPVIIGADPKGGKGRGVVSTANYEARKYGVGSALPIKWAYQRCPQGVFLPVDFTLYRAVSRRIFEFIASLGFTFEQIGIDEGYVDLSKLSFSGAKRLAEQIQQSLYEKEKLTCSMGIGPNKMIAKIGSDFNKPNGITMVLPEEVESFLAPLNVKKIPGIGPKTTEWLNKKGVKVIGDLAQLSEEELVDKYGEFRGPWFYRVCRGIDNRTIGNYRERKSIGAERTFFEDVDNKEVIMKKLDELIERIYTRMHNYELTSKTVVLKIRYADFETHTVQRTVEQEFTNKEEVASVARDLLYPFLNEKKIRLIGARFTGLHGRKEAKEKSIPITEF